MSTDNPTPTPNPLPPLPSGNTGGILGWLTRLLILNYKSWIVYFATVLSVLLYNGCLKPPDAPPEPLPEPPPLVWPDGWVAPSEEEREKTLAYLKRAQGFAKFAETEAAEIIFSGEEDIPLWKFYQLANGTPLPSRDQLNIGSCVSFGYAGAIEVRIATQIQTKRGPPLQAVKDIVQEAIYAGARVDINNGRLNPELGGGDGACGAWAVKSISTGGVLERKVYGSHDLTTYSVERCRDWGNRGTPEELKKLARNNLCTYALVQTSAEAVKALEIGCPIAVCSNVGYGNLSSGPATRDGDGRLKASGQWNHCMYIAGYRADNKTFLIVNSWGTNWVNGPKGKYEDIPDGSFWASTSDVGRMLSQKDSYAISGVNGFKRTKLKPEDWSVRLPKVRPNFPLMVGVNDVFPMAF